MSFVPRDRQCSLRQSSEFCSPRLSMFHEAKPRGILRVKGKQNSLFPMGPVIKCFVIPPSSKIVQIIYRFICLTPAGTQICSGFKMHNLIMCKSKVQFYNNLYLYQPMQGLIKKSIIFILIYRKERWLMSSPYLP